MIINLKNSKNLSTNDLRNSYQVQWWYIHEFYADSLKLGSAIFHYFQKTNVFLRFFKQSTLKRNLTYSCFFFQLFHKKFILSRAAMHYPPPWNFLIRKNNCMCNRDNACDVAACSDESSTKRSELNKPCTNHDKHHERFSKLCYTLNTWEHMPLNIKSNEIIF